MEDIARHAGTISYDLTCGMTKRVMFVEDDSLMAKARTAYVCSQCGAEYSKWQGQCDDCGAWNTLREFVVEPRESRRRSKRARLRGRHRREDRRADRGGDGRPKSRTLTGIGELDRVLGGGLVEGSVVLVGGDPGIGKSTLLLQTLGALGCATERRCT